jgi:hypothetical protein
MSEIPKKKVESQGGYPKERLKREQIPEGEIELPIVMSKAIVGRTPLIAVDCGGSKSLG